MFQNVDVELLHDLHDEVEALHEAVDGDAEHAVRGGLVVDAEDGRFGGVLLDGEGAPDERRELLVDCEGLVGDGGQARGRERDVDSSAEILS